MIVSFSPCGPIPPSARCANETCKLRKICVIFRRQNCYIGVRLRRLSVRQFGRRHVQIPSKLHVEIRPFVCAERKFLFYVFYELGIDVQLWLYADHQIRCSHDVQIVQPCQVFWRCRIIFFFITAFSDFVHNIDRLEFFFRHLSLVVRIRHRPTLLCKAEKALNCASSFL